MSVYMAYKCAKEAYQRGEITADEYADAERDWLTEEPDEEVFEDDDIDEF